MRQVAPPADYCIPVTWPHKPNLSKPNSVMTFGWIRRKKWLRVSMSECATGMSEATSGNRCASASHAFSPATAARCLPDDQITLANDQFALPLLRSLAFLLAQLRARKTQFVEAIQSDLGRPVVVRKIFRFALAPNQWLPSHVPPRHEGRIAVVTNVEAGCGGRAGHDRRTWLARTAKSCGPGA